MDKIDFIALGLLLILCVSAYMNGGWKLMQWVFIGAACGYGLAAAKAARIFMQAADEDQACVAGERGEGEK